MIDRFLLRGVKPWWSHFTTYISRWATIVTQNAQWETYQSFWNGGSITKYQICKLSPTYSIITWKSANGNCSYVINFSNPIFVFFLLFLVIFFRSFILFRMLLISLWKVIFERNSTKRMLFQKKTFTFQRAVKPWWSRLLVI